jgi:hypothetical protein
MQRKKTKNNKRTKTKRPMPIAGKAKKKWLNTIIGEILY